MTHSLAPITVIDERFMLVRGRHGLFLVNRHDLYVGQALIQYGEYGEHEWTVLRQLIKPGCVVMEIGANIGAHTVSLAKAVGNQGRVIAVEPLRVIFQNLCANIALNSLFNVTTIHGGCGRVAGHMFTPWIDFTKNTMNNFGGVSLKQDETGEPVAIHTVDDLAQNTPIHLIKVDVEGMELEVLLGAQQTISRSRPILYMENDRVDKSAALIRAIMNMNYRLWWHMPKLFNVDNFFGNQENKQPKASINMLCLPSETKSALNGFKEITDPDTHPLLRQE